MKLLILRHIILLLLVVQISYAQQSAKYSYSLGGEVFEGFILRHHKYLGHLIKSRPTGFEISVRQQTNGTKNWEANYGYPEVAYNLSYYDLKNDVQLGKVITLSSGMGFHLIGEPPFKNDLQFYYGIGLAFSTNPYNQDTNNLNNVISSTVSYNGNLKLSYNHRIGEKLRLGVGVKLTHFSNGSIKLPNYGLNIFSANLIASYKISNTTSEFKKEEQNLVLDRKLKFGAIFRLGFAEAPPVGSGVKPVYGFSLIAQKRVSLKSLLDVGIEMYANKAVEYEITSGPAVEGEIPDYKRLGLMVGHELVVNKLTLVAQLGFYLYKPYFPNERIYSRIGFSYYFTNHLYGSMTLKTHFAVAEVIEYGIGFRF